MTAWYYPATQAALADSTSGDGADTVDCLRGGRGSKA